MLLPDAEYAKKDSIHGYDVSFSDTCGCYSEYTQEPCSLYVNIVGTLPEGEKAQYTLDQAITNRIEKWAKLHLTWSGCESCGNGLSVLTYIYGKVVNTEAKS